MKKAAILTVLVALALLTPRIGGGTPVDCSNPLREPHSRNRDPLAARGTGPAIVVFSRS